MSHNLFRRFGPLLRDMTEAELAAEIARPQRLLLEDAIGSQGRSTRSAGLFPHSPFNPCVRFSRTRLTDDLLDMVTQPSGSG